MIKKIYTFLTIELWRIDLKQLPKAQRFLLNQVRIIALSIRGFNEDKCMLRASALTFYSLLSIVPVIALAFAIAKGFGYEKTLQADIMATAGRYEDIWQQVFQFANSLLDNTKGGLVGGIGVAVLLYTVLRVLAQIEESMNDIWQIKKARSILRKFSDYFSIMLIAPILLVLSSSVMVFIKTQIQEITQSIALLGYFSPLIGFFLKLLPYTLIWVALTFIYMIMPNTKVQIKPAIIGGVIAGTLFVLAEWLYIYFQVGVARYNAIYGSFAALPLFLIWLQTSWVIVLLGAEISFAYQNVKRFEYEYDSQHLSLTHRRKLAVVILTEIIRSFKKEEEPLSADTLSDKLELPIRVIRSVLYELTDAHLISQVHQDRDEEELFYQPSKPLDYYDMAYVIHELDEHGIDSIPVKDKVLMDTVNHSFDSLYKNMKGAEANLKLQEIAK